MTYSGRTGNTFVGRQREMGELTSALEDAMAGHGRLVMLVGEPGIGKTRLAQELASLAESLGAQVMWGWCYEHTGAPPYWPYVQPIRAYVAMADAPRLNSEMGLGGAEIAELVPELREKLPDLGQSVVTAPEQARFRLFDSVATFLKNASQSRPLVLVLDDLQWADESSLLLLEFLARELAASPILVVGAYRDNEVTESRRLAQTLGSLVREEHYQRVRLSGLSRQEVAEFVEARAGIAIADAAVDTLHQRTEGNPLFVGEVVGSVGPEEMGRDQAWITSIPEAVRDAILGRLNRLSEPCNQILRTASVIGRDFDLSLLRALCPEFPENEFLESLDEALGKRIVESLPAGPRGYRFGHALIQQAVYEEIPPMRKARAHAATGETLEQLHQNNLDEHAAALAHHFAAAEAVIGTEQLVRYSLLAGDRALASYAYEDAYSHFERGLAARDIALSGTETASDEEAAALLFGLARAKSATGVGHQLVEAFATLNRAFEYYAGAGNVAQAVAAAEFPIAAPPVLIPGVTQLLARALTMVPADSHEAGLLLSRYGVILGAENDYKGAQQALSRAITIAKREGDSRLEVRTLSNTAFVSGLHLHYQESVDNGLRAIELASADENPYSEVVSRFWTATSLLIMGDVDAARPHALALRDLAGKRSTPMQIASDALTPITSLSCLVGDWNAGREFGDRSLELSPLNPQILAPRVLLEHETGESSHGEVYLERLLEAAGRAGAVQLMASGRTSLAIPTIARVTGVPDRFEIAEAAAESVLSKQSVFPLFAMHAKAGLALLAVEKGDQSAAAEHYAYLLGQRGTMIWTASSVDRLLGLLSHTMGNIDHAAAHFEDALAFCRKAGYRPELAWTCSDYADALLQRNSPDDSGKSKALLDEALAISTELGMKPLKERVAALQDRAEAQPVRKPAYPGGLTQREIEVLRLVASGNTSAEIAADLVLSRRTVERHISNIYSKTLSRTRAEATAFAFTHGLMSSS